MIGRKKSSRALLFIAPLLILILSGASKTNRTRKPSSLENSVNHSTEQHHSGSDMASPDFLDDTDLKYPLVSRSNCETASGGFLTHCRAPDVVVVESRKKLPKIPFTSSLTVTHTSNCQNNNNLGLLQVEIFNSKGKFKAYEYLDYQSETRKSLTLVDGKPIGQLHIGTKNPEFFTRNQFPDFCEIYLNVELNDIAPKTKKEADKIKKLLDSELAKTQERFDFLSALNDLKAHQFRITQAFQAFVNQTTENPSTSFFSPLLQLDTERLDSILLNSEAELDPRLQDLLGDISEIIKSAQQRAATQPTPRNLGDFLTERDLGTIREAERKIGLLVDDQKLIAAKEKLEKRQAKYQAALALLAPLKILILNEKS